MITRYYTFLREDYEFYDSPYGESPRYMYPIPNDKILETAKKEFFYKNKREINYVD